MRAEPGRPGWASRRVGLLRVLLRRVVGGGVVPAATFAVRHPGRVLVHLRRVAAGDTAGVSNRYGVTERHPQLERDEEVAWLTAVVGCTRAAALRVLDELAADEELRASLEERYATARPEWSASFDFGRFRLVYGVVRLVQPDTVVETGVHDGLSSALILRALAVANRGRLVSIDRPGSDLPVTEAGAGWLIPTTLRERWQLHVGDAVRLLPTVAADVRPVDVFLHDSDHSRAHRRFEFETVGPHLSPRGIILSDDDEERDGLLRSLGERWGRRYVPPPRGSIGIGALAPGDAGPAAAS